MGDRPFKLFAFDVQAPAHLTAGSWRNGDDQGDRYKDLTYWTATAKLLEEACFDGLFLADTVGYHDVYAGGPDAAMRDAAQFPINDPALLVSGMAAVTEHLGFGVTSSLTYEQPYSMARKFSTLDHLTGGRVGWNIVTSYSESAARNFGMGKQMPHDQRYDLAEEYMEVCYRLWEYSWRDDAVVRDRDAATYIDPSRVREINHSGQYFQVPGFHLCEPSPQRTPVLFQAGASSRGVSFAGKHAEAVFINTMTPELSQRSVAKVRQAAADAGRDPRSIQVLALITVVVAPTDEQAQEKYESYLRSVSYDGALARFAGWTGIDLSGYDPDMPLQYAETEGVRSIIEMFSKADPSRTWTPRQIAEFLGIGGTGAVVVGSPQTVARELRRWRDVADIDGFNLSYTSKPASWNEFIEIALPELRRQGLAQESYDRTAATLREKFHGAGNRLALPGHPASAVREADGVPAAPALV